MNSTIPSIRRAMELMLNVLLVGPHGVGKTLMVVTQARLLGLVLKYYSASTLDPWTDLVGVPVPCDVEDRSTNVLRKELLFVRPADLDNAEILFFDELNRSHPKVQNAVLEAIQFRTINGRPLPRLKMVWAAINPPGDIYAVTELDPVLEDRFHVILPVPAEPSVAYYRDIAGITEHVAKALVNWWRRDLDDDLRKIISPRRLEYIGKIYGTGIELRHSLPLSVRAPLANLVRRLEERAVLPFELTRGTLVSRQQEILAEMDGNAEVMLAVGEQLQAWPDIIVQSVPLFLALASELQASLIKSEKIRTALTNLAREGRRGKREFRALVDRLSAMGIPVR